MFSFASETTKDDPLDKDFNVNDVLDDISENCNRSVFAETVKKIDKKETNKQALTKKVKKVRTSIT